MSDDRLFFKLHNGFPEHPKTIELSDKAFRQLVEAWCYCSRNLNDGYLTKSQFLKFFSPKSRGELTAVGFVREEENQYVMHDYLEHQQSAQQVSDLRERRRQAGSKGGKAKANGLASAKQMPKQMPSKSLPDTDLDTDVDATEAKASVSESQIKNEFIDWYLEYPRKESKAAAEKAYIKARKKASADELLAGAIRYADDPNREAQYTKLPATWLNAGCWEDGPLPARNGPTQPMDHSARAKAKEADMLARWQQSQTNDFLEIEG